MREKIAPAGMLVTIPDFLTEEHKIMYGKYIKSLFWPRKNPGYAILLAEKAPAGMGTPRPGFAKLRFGLGLARARIACGSGRGRPCILDEK